MLCKRYGSAVPSDFWSVQKLITNISAALASDEGDKIFSSELKNAFEADSAELKSCTKSFRKNYQRLDIVSKSYSLIMVL